MEVLFCEIDGRVLGGMQFRVGGAALRSLECWWRGCFARDGGLLWGHAVSGTGGGAALRDRGHVVWSVGGGAVLPD